MCKSKKNYLSRFLNIRYSGLFIIVSLLIPLQVNQEVRTLIANLNMVNIYNLNNLELPNKLYTYYTLFQSQFEEC